MNEALRRLSDAAGWVNEKIEEREIWSGHVDVRRDGIELRLSIHHDNEQYWHQHVVSWSELEYARTNILLTALDSMLRRLKAAREAQ